LEVGREARALLLKLGTSSEFGARELKRTILRQLTQPLAALVEVGRVAPGSTVRAEVAADRERISLEVEGD
jgi:ATP-dependent Clp protease ATP-binding subunit ClpA